MSRGARRGRSPWQRVPCRSAGPQKPRRALPLKGLLAAALVGAAAWAPLWMRYAWPAAAPPGGAAASQPSGPPPLEVDEGAPLLLDKPIVQQPVPGTPDKPPADNSACYVCHANYQAESLVASHVVEGTGCVQCHGESTAHRNDENNITPPDIMFSRERIERGCIECHPTHDVPPKKVLAVFRERCPKDVDWESIACTDCHGEHRLKVRTVRWDKRTGQLLTAASKL